MGKWWKSIYSYWIEVVLYFESLDSGAARKSGWNFSNLRRSLGFLKRDPKPTRPKLGVPFASRAIAGGLEFSSSDVESDDPVRAIDESLHTDGMVLSLTIVTDILPTLVSLVSARSETRFSM